MKQNYDITVDASNKMVKCDVDHPAVQRALQCISDTYVSHEVHREEIWNIQNLKKEAFKIEQPSGLRRVPSSLLIQIGDMVERKMQVPSANYSLQIDDPQVDGDLVASIIREGVETVMEMGGFEACMVGKPSMFRCAVDNGDSYLQYGSHEDLPIKFSMVSPDMVYVDPGATVINSQSGGRSVTRMLIIYSYDKHEVENMFPGLNFEIGKIPNQMTYLKDFEKSWQQDIEANKYKTQVAHYFDIGENPLHATFVGSQCSLWEAKEGDDYDFIDGKTKKPYIPVEGFIYKQSEEGFYNYGIGHIFYRYTIMKRQLFNKAIVQSMNAMNDTQIINTGKFKASEMLYRIQQARELSQNGQMGTIINDKGDPVTVTKLQADQYDQSLLLLNQWFDTEIKRFGYNLDAIRTDTQTTATQVLAESEVEDETVAHVMNKNTQFFKNVHYRTMDAIIAKVKKSDKTPIWTSLKIPSGFMNKHTGKQIMKSQVVTLGEIKTLLDQYREGIYVEIDTKSGIKERDTIKIARSLMLMRSTQDPSAQAQALKALMSANGFDPDSLQQQQQVQGNPQGIQQNIQNFQQGQGGGQTQATPQAAAQLNMNMP